LPAALAVPKCNDDDVSVVPVPNNPVPTDDPADGGWDGTRLKPALPNRGIGVAFDFSPTSVLGSTGMVVDDDDGTPKVNANDGCAVVEVDAIVGVVVDPGPPKIFGAAVAGFSDGSGAAAVVVVVDTTVGVTLRDTTTFDDLFRSVVIYRLVIASWFIVSIRFVFDPPHPIVCDRSTALHWAAYGLGRSTPVLVFSLGTGFRVVAVGRAVAEAKRLMFPNGLLAGLSSGSSFC
jgi:hypothetical protein